MTRIGVQLYSLRETPGTLPELLEAVGETAFEGVEFAHRYADSSPTAVATALNRYDLTTLGAHVGFDAMESKPDELVVEYDPANCSRFVLPHVPQTEFETEERVTGLLSRLNRVAETLDGVGASFCHHNQAHDFTTVDGHRALDQLMEETDDSVGFELDVGGAVTAGVDPVALIEAYGDRIPLVHLKDVLAPDPSPTAPQQCVPIGTGDVDLEAVAATAVDTGVEWLVYENDDPDDPVEALERGAKTLENLVD
jgi:sugar phosphate isomerase/epimerase